MLDKSAFQRSTEALIADPHAHYMAQAEGQELSKEVAALRKDKGRLDRLDQLNAALNAKYGTTYPWQVIVNHNINRLMLGHLQIDLSDSAAFGLPSCRDALDTIMPGVSPRREIAIMTSALEHKSHAFAKTWKGSAGSGTRRKPRPRRPGITSPPYSPTPTATSQATTTGAKHRQSEVEQLTRDVEALRARVVVPDVRHSPYVASHRAGNTWAEMADDENGERVNIERLARLNGKTVSEGLLRCCEQRLQFYFEHLCDESAEEGDIAMAAEARDELRELLDNWKGNGQLGDKQKAGAGPYS